MKKIITTLSVILVAASMAAAQTLTKTSPSSYAGYLANETGLAYSNTFALDVASYDAAKVSAVVNYATATYSSKTFNELYYSASSDIITMANHGFTLGLPILYTATVTIGGLSTGTTCYALPVTANSLRLSSTSANAVAGVYIDITSQRSTSTLDTFTLAPLAMGAYNASAKWQYSNDGTNYIDVPTVASIFVSSATSSTFAGWDFGTYDYRYLRLNVTGPTQGGIVIKAMMHVKK